MNRPPIEPFVPSEEALDTEELRAEDHVMLVVGQYMAASQMAGIAPLVATSNLLGALFDGLQAAVDVEIVRGSFLMVYEKSFPQPMTLIDRQKAKELLDAISNARRKVEGKPHLILPGDDDA